MSHCAANFKVSMASKKIHSVCGVTGGMLAPVGSTDKAKISLSLSSRNRWMIIYWPRPRPQREGGFLGSARTGRAGRRTPRRGPLPLRLAEPEASLPWLVDPVGKPDQRSEDCCRGPFAIAIPGDTCGKALDWQVKTGLGVDGHLGYRRIARTVHIFRAVLCAATVERIGRPDETRQAGRRAPPLALEFCGEPMSGRLAAVAARRWQRSLRWCPRCNGSKLPRCCAGSSRHCRSQQPKRMPGSQRREACLVLGGERPTLAPKSGQKHVQSLRAT